VTPSEPIFFDTPEALRAWFEANAETAPELIVGFRRKASGLPTISWSAAVDEALCFGWIDGIRRGIDEISFSNRFTPRRRGSAWSTVNVAKVEALIAAGRMKPAGTKAFEARTEARTGIYSYENPATPIRELAPDELDRLRANADAWAWWTGKPAGYRRLASTWVASAKQPATRERRLVTLIEDCAAGRPIKPLSYGKR
jgi:uncharacterized protein YdeI (YjbR/CyaY-like superfamily)